MKKKVNITPTLPIYSVVPPIVGVSKNVELNVGDIARCIYSRALVDEVFDDGTTIRLDLSNYDKDNSKKEKVEIETSLSSFSSTGRSTTVELKNTITPEVKKTTGQK